MSAVEPIRKKTDIKKVEAELLKQGMRNLLFFDIGINCGLRISDILALNVGDVKNKDYIRLVEQKTGKYRKIPINSKLKALFELYTTGKNDNEPLFVTKYKNRLERVAAYRIVKQACVAAGLDCKIGTHTLRKTFGYHHYKLFKDVVMLQKIFNHSAPQITLRYIGIEQEAIDRSYIKLVL